MADGGRRAEIYTYEASFPIYAANWSVRPAARVLPGAQRRGGAAAAWPPLRRPASSHRPGDSRGALASAPLGPTFPRGRRLAPPVGAS